MANALNFNTADCHVVGGCDLYTTKAASNDKKLYRSIEQSLESQHSSLLSFSASLSPAKAREAAVDLNLSRSSPFGPLSQSSSRRTFAYLIATLNASHPDYDVSHLLRPSDFHREKSLRKVMHTLDKTLYSLRPKPVVSGTARNWSSQVSSLIPFTSSGTEVWGARMWRLIDKEMSLRECGIYRYLPENDPYDGEDGAIWSYSYFFFNKARKRVCYIYLRGLSIMSHSPIARASAKAIRSPNDSWSSDEPSNRKRARFWLGDRAADVYSGWGEDEDEDITEPWENEGVIPVDYLFGDNEHDPEAAGGRLEDSRLSISSAMSSNPASPHSERSRSKSTVRGVSEDIAERMEV